MVMKRKITMMMVLSLIFTLLLSGRAFADWKGEQKWKFVNEDGSCKADEWFTDEAGKTYYIDRDGYMVMGWHQEEDGTWYFFDGKGVLVKGLAVIDGLSYYFLEDGSLFEGERLIGGQRFRFSKDGTSYPQEMTDYGACYSSDGILIREQGQYDKDNPGHYLPFLVLFLMAAAMGWYGKRAGQGPEMVFIFAAVLLSSTPLLVRFMPPGHDLTFHLNRILGVEESLKAGMIPVRINGFSFNGYGYPDPVFYPQLFLYVPAVLHGLGVPFVASVHTFLLLVNFGAALVMYLCGTKMFHSTVTGCISSVVYTMGVYRLCNIYTRAAYGELLAMVFFPLVIWGLYELFYGDEGYWLSLPIAFTGIFQSHLISTVLVAAGCVVFGIVGIRKFKERSRLLAFLKVLGLTLALNVWTLVPLLQYMLTDIDTSSLQIMAQEKSVPWPVFLKLFSKAGGSSPVYLEDMSSAMALPLGFILICGLILAIVLRFFTKEKLPPMVSALLWTGIGLTVAASDVFPWHTLVKLPFVDVAASYIQFPWRFLAVSTCCLAFVTAYGAVRVWRDRNKSLLYLGILAVSMVSTQYYIDEVNGLQAKVWTEYNVPSAIGKSEYLYPETMTDNLMGQYYPSGDQVQVTSLEKDRLSVRCSYEISGSGEGAYIEVPLFYFPGYKGIDHGGNELSLERGRGNLIRVNLTQPSGEFRVFFQEPLLWRAMEAVSLGAFAFGVWSLWVMVRRGLPVPGAARVRKQDGDHT